MLLCAPLLIFLVGPFVLRVVSHLRGVSNAMWLATQQEGESGVSAKIANSKNQTKPDSYHSIQCIIIHCLNKIGENAFRKSLTIGLKRTSIVDDEIWLVDIYIYDIRHTMLFPCEIYGISIVKGGMKKKIIDNILIL